jgi:UDP-N-acetylglucosamine 2-epimerase
MKTLAIIGTRPQYLKVSRKWADIIVDTGQHYDKEMTADSPKVDYNLNVTDLWQMVGVLETVIESEKPDIVVVVGDTRSTYAGAVAAKYCGKFLVHLEAGMRSHEDTQEERIRVAVDRLSDCWLCATDECKDNLDDEGFINNVLVVGDPAFEALRATTPHKGKKWANREKEPYMLLTLHRAELVDDAKKLQEVLGAIGETGRRVIWPKHPRVKGVAIPKNIEVVDPVSHEDLIRLILHADKVLTDSGGVQREAYWLLKTVIIIREKTEHTQITSGGCGTLTGYDKKKIIKAIETFKSTGIPELPLTQTHERIEAILEDLEGIPDTR